jgi:predicted lipoprotein with Yx(FWY)xxD motif
MRRHEKEIIRGLSIFVLAVVTAGCASASPSTAKTPGAPGSGAGTTATEAPGASANASVKVASLSIGDALVTPDGMTLYLLTSDPKGQSTCDNSCAAAWPPYTITGQPAAGQGVDASLLGTITRSDGSQQLTYTGHALYTFSADSAAGDINGQGIQSYGGTWYVVGPDGQAITSAVNSSGTGGSY